jgi:branched-chain amino acid transport system ATP-binding protein
MSAELLLEMRNITAGYGKMMVLFDIGMKCRRGDIVTLLGANGVGKTTTLRAILGQIHVKSGAIRFNGTDICGLPPHRIAELGIAHSPEGRSIFGNLTVLENLRAGAHLLKTRAELREHLDRVYSLFPRLKERRGQVAGSLSGGEQQMLAMGRALMSNPTLMLLDEPSLGLAPQLVKLVADTLREVNRTGTSVLLVEQNARLALEIAGYGYVMEKGTIALEGESRQLSADEGIKRIYLGLADQLDERDSGRGGCSG